MWTIAAAVAVCLVLSLAAWGMLVIRRRGRAYTLALAPRMAELCVAQLSETVGGGQDRQRWRVDFATMELTGSFELDAIKFETRYLLARTYDNQWYSRMQPADARGGQRLPPPAPGAVRIERAEVERHFRQAQEACWNRLGAALPAWLGLRYLDCLGFFAEHPGLTPALGRARYALGWYSRLHVWKPPRHEADDEIKDSAALLEQWAGLHKSLVPYQEIVAERTAAAIQRSYTTIMLPLAGEAAASSTVMRPHEFAIFSDFLATARPYLEGPELRDPAAPLHKAQRAVVALLAAKRQAGGATVTVTREELRVLFGFYFEVRQAVKTALSMGAPPQLRAVYELYKQQLVQLAEALDPEIRGFFRSSVRPGA